LQSIEHPKPKLQKELSQIASTISKIRDPEKRAPALVEFNILCRALGVELE
jgi:hypothetical protein